MNKTDTDNDPRTEEVEDLTFDVVNNLDDLTSEKLGVFNPTAAGLLAARLHRAGWRKIAGPYGEVGER